MATKTQQTFEICYKRLEEILQAMNEQELSLENSLNLYEEADKLINFCNKELENSEKKINQLIKNRDHELLLTPSGKPQEDTFNPDTH